MSTDYNLIRNKKELAPRDGDKDIRFIKRQNALKENRNKRRERRENEAKRRSKRQRVRITTIGWLMMAHRR